jgi:D-lactate dehydrogenase
MMMALNRRIHRAYQRTRDANFSLEGLTGFTMYGKTAGVIGTGKIGVAALRILKGFGMRLLAFDPYPSAAALELGVEYVDLTTLFSESDVISLHCPLTPENYHLLNHAAFDQMKDGVMIVNTSRGGLIDSQAAIEALKNQKIGSLGWMCTRTNAISSLKTNLMTSFRTTFSVACRPAITCSLPGIRHF